MKTPPILSPQEWEAARQQLLVKEKELRVAPEGLELLVHTWAGE